MKFMHLKHITFTSIFIVVAFATSRWRDGGRMRLVYGNEAVLANASGSQFIARIEEELGCSWSCRLGIRVIDKVPFLYEKPYSFASGIWFFCFAIDDIFT